MTRQPTLERPLEKGLDFSLHEKSRIDLSSKPTCYSDQNLIHLFLKRSFDLLAGVTLLIVLSPLMAAIALLVRLDSKGPIIFKQQRPGWNGKLFWMYKFRSMTIDADDKQPGMRDKNEADGIIFKMKNDPRITPFGRFLRRFSLDELPQLYNVVRGDMSLIGPRPFTMEDFRHGPKNDRKYSEWVYRRHQVRPGITGLWQVSGRADVSFDKLMDLDLSYVRRWNFLIDFWILFKTLPAVFKKSGAY